MLKKVFVSRFPRLAYTPGRPEEVCTQGGGGGRRKLFFLPLLRENPPRPPTRPHPRPPACPCRGAPAALEQLQQDAASLACLA